MIQEYEILMLAFGVVVAVFLLHRRREVREVPQARLLLGAFFAVFGAWIVTIAEGFVLEGALNAVEHTLYAASGGLLAIWAYKVNFPRRDGVEHDRAP